jgi:hypothetical protein
MASLDLAAADIGRFADFEATRVVLPRLSGWQPAQAFEEALVGPFEGDLYQTAFGGTGEPRSHQLTVRFRSDEHQTMADLIALFVAAHRSADRRLLLRQNSFLVGDLNPIEVITVATYTPTYVSGQVWDLVFTATSVEYTVEV